MMEIMDALKFAEMPAQQPVVADMPDIPQWHKGELDKRLAAHAANPNDTVAWADVKKGLLG